MTHYCAKVQRLIRFRPELEVIPYTYLSIVNFLLAIKLKICNNEYINDGKLGGKSHKRGWNFVSCMVKFVVYAVIEIILKANVRHKGDKFMKQNVVRLIMIMFLLMLMTMFISMPYITNKYCVARSS